MFDVDTNGDLLYVPDTGSGNAAALPAGTLFDPDPDSSAAVMEDPTESSLPTPEIGQDDPADVDILPLESPEPLLTGSGNAVSLPIGDDITLSTSGDIYIYPETGAADLPEARSATSASVEGLPNSTSLSYLEDVVNGYPSWYKYMAFKSDASYSQSMVLWIAPQGVKNASQNRIDFTDVDCIDVAYTRSGSTNYYQYRKTHYDSYQIPYDSDVFLYTNVVDGYAQFLPEESIPVKSILFSVFLLVVGLLIFRGGGKT